MIYIIWFYLPPKASTKKKPDEYKKNKQIVMNWKEFKLTSENNIIN